VVRVWQKGNETLPLRPRRGRRHALPLRRGRRRPLPRPPVRPPRRPHRHARARGRRLPPRARRRRGARRERGGRTVGSDRARVERARRRQRARYAALPGERCNAHVAGRWLDTRTPVDGAARELLAAAAERLGLSARGYHQVLKVARTVADLDDAACVTPGAVAEALRYRAAPATPAVPAARAAAR